MSAKFGGALAFEPSFSDPFGTENPTSIALEVESGAPVCGFVTSALHKHGIMLSLIGSFPLSNFCSDYMWKATHEDWVTLCFICAGTYTYSR